MREINSTHFELEIVTEGIFAAIHKEGGWAIANAGIIDLGDSTVVYDTFLSPEAAVDLRTAAEAVTGRQVDRVINSHYHNDHVWGNQVFKPRAEIISTLETQRLLLTKGQEEYYFYRNHSSSRLAEWLGKLEAEADAEKRRAIGFWVTYYEGLVQSMPSLKICRPDRVFEGKLDLEGTERTAQLISFTNAHTESDTILYLPSDGVIFTSDLLFVGCHPYLADGDPQELISVLSQIQSLDAQIYIPGHGRVGGPQDIDLLVDYIDSCHRSADTLAADDAILESSLGLSIPAPFDKWQLSEFYEMNVRAMHKRILASQKTHGQH